MFPITLALLIISQAVAQPVPPQDDIKDALAHAEALYYGARFNESIALLSRLDDTLKSQPMRLQEKINTKLQLALAHIGLNEADQAKALLGELYALDSDYALDPGQFSPKVIALAADAKAEQTKLQCETAERDARGLLDSRKTGPLLNLFRSLRSKCPKLAAIEPEAADSFFKTGLAAYKQGDFAAALPNFEAAVTFSPEHELAFQYIDLTTNKLQLNQDRLLLEWQRKFDAHQLSAASDDYRHIMLLNNGRSTPATTHMADEYRKILAALVESWNQACPTGDPAALNSIRRQIADLLPDPSFGEDLRGKMVMCEPTAPKVTANPVIESQPKVNASGKCFDMQPELVLARLRTRVAPAITSEMRNYFKNGQVTVHVRARISETGDVTVTGMPDGNPVLNDVVRTAVSQWKFAQIRDQSGPRCVDTEIPLVIGLSR
jgi:hypothetical protein